MSSPSLWVPQSIYDKAKKLLTNNSNGNDIRDGVELVLQNDLEKIPNGMDISNKIDAGSILKQGLADLAKQPHSALGLDLGAQTIDVKKAFRKAALKYHPDKNPHTTPLFQAIQSAKERLSDRSGRREEEAAARARNRRKAGSGYASKPAQSSSYQQQSKYQQPKPPSQHPGSNYNGYWQQQQHSQHSQKQQSQYPQYQRNYNNKSQNQTESNNPYAKYAYGTSSSKYTQQKRPEQQYPGAGYSYGYDQAKGHQFESEWSRRRDEYIRKQAEQAKHAEAGRMAKELERKRREEAAAREREQRSRYESRTDAAARQRRAHMEEQEKVRKAREEQARQQRYSMHGRDKEHARASEAAARRFQERNQYQKPESKPDTYATYGERNKSYASYMKEQRREAEIQKEKEREMQKEKEKQKEEERRTGFKEERPLYPPSGADNLKGRGRNPKSDRNVPPPKPLGLKCNLVKEMDKASNPDAGTGATDEYFKEASLQWIVPPGTAVELNWRYTVMAGAGPKYSTGWESAKKLIAGGRCVKKNLLEGCAYEFRVRSVNQLDGGVMGERSEWSAPLVLNLNKRQPLPTKAKEEPSKNSKPKTTSSTSSSSSSSSSKAKTKANAEESSRQQSSIPKPTTKLETENHNKNQRVYGRRSPRPSAPSTDSDSRSARTKVDKEWNIPHNKAETPPERTPDSDDDEILDDVDVSGENQDIGGDSDADDVADEAGHGFRSPKAKDKASAASPKNASPRYADLMAERRRRERVASKPSNNNPMDRATKLDMNREWYILNGPGESRDYQHPVFEEPLSGSRLIGYVIAGLPIEVGGFVGDWAKVRVHRRLKQSRDRNAAKQRRRASSRSMDSDVKDYEEEDLNGLGIVKWGWCERKYEAHEFLKKTTSLPTGASRDTNRSGRRASADNVNFKSSPRGDKKMNNFAFFDEEENTGDNFTEREEAQSFAKVRKEMREGKFDKSKNNKTNDAPPTPVRHAFGAEPSNKRGSASIDDTVEEGEDDIDEVQHSPGGPDMGSTLEGFGTRVGLGDDDGDGEHSFSDASSDDDSEDKADAVSEWYEYRDASNRVYYYNSKTEESRWEAPEWVEEIDPDSGAAYYLKLNVVDSQPLHSTWSRPQQFSRIIRS